MNAKRRPLKRPLGERRYKKLFVIATEGSKTEPQYFSIFNDQNSIVKVLKGKNRSSPQQVLKRIKIAIKDESWQPSDEAWIVVDKDNWTDEQLLELYEWSKQNIKHGLAISNPKFEYWLLLHFEDGHKVSNGRECMVRLKKYLPEYEKNFDPRIITKSMIDKAVERAKKSGAFSSEKWPLKTGSTVYKLIERITALTKD